jgi:FlaA1/EpsC-like NDP-sugar epimerase
MKGRTGRPSDRVTNPDRRSPWSTLTGLKADLPLLAWDVVAVLLAYTLAMLAVAAGELGGAAPADPRSAAPATLITAVVLHVGANLAAGLYGRVWRHAGVAEARRLVVSGTVVALAWVVLSLLGLVPGLLSVAVAGGSVAMALIVAARFARRLLRSRDSEGRQPAHRSRVVVLGAGDAGGQVIRDMLRQPQLGLVPAVILDDDRRLHGRELGGARVHGGLDALSEVARRYRADLALLAVPSADSQLVRRVAEYAEAAGIPLKRLPRLEQLIDENVSVRDVRDLEIADLLGRQQVQTDLEGVRRRLTGRRVLITGAGGSIGSEIARQVARLDPAQLVLLDHDETHLHDVVTQLDRSCDQVLADVRDGGLVRSIFAVHRPQVVFHAAAHKHVPILEHHPCEAAATNVLGTRHVTAAAAAVGVEQLVFVSTDKAVNPSSVMGASKAVGEQLTLHHMPEGAHWCAVRFGNVVGSRGSVIPTFMRQIRAGGPVTVTDPRMTRFFMSIEESVQLVLQAAALARGGEIFMLDMGEPVRIVDLAERMIRLSGRQVGVDIEIQFTGVREGEKLDEELRRGDEQLTATEHPVIHRIQPRLVSDSDLASGLESITGAVAARDDAVVDELFALAYGGRSVVRLRGGDSGARVLRGREPSDPHVSRLRGGETDGSVLRMRGEAGSPSTRI